MPEFTPVIVLHMINALVAAVVGIFVLIVKKGTSTHRRAGRIWLSCMIIAIVSSFGIRELRGLFGYSWIHLLSIYTLFSLIAAVVFIKNGKRRAHRLAMIGTYVGLIIAGLFALAPGRRLALLIIGV